MSEWLPIESAPRDGTEILVFCDDGFIKHYAVVFSSMTNHWSDGMDIYEPSHWMPLPPPPTDPTHDHDD